MQTTYRRVPANAPQPTSNTMRNRLSIRHAWPLQQNSLPTLSLELSWTSFLLALILTIETRSLKASLKTYIPQAILDRIRPY